MAKRIRRNHEREAWFLGGIVLCVVIALWVAMKDFPVIVRVMIPAVDLGLAVLLYLWMQKTTGIVECPACGGIVHNVPVANNPAMLCQFCGTFSVGKGNTVDVPALSHVAERPVFGAVLPRGEPAWADECASCGAASTRTVDVKIVTPALHLVKVPHCDQHADGAVLLRPDDAPNIVILFRRYGAYQRFAEANGTTPYQL